MFEIVERVSYDIYKVLDHNDGLLIFFTKT